MSVVVKVFNAIDEHDLEALSELIHDDFVYFHDYEIRTKKDWLDGVREGLEMEGKFTDERRILCDTADCYAIQRTANIDGKKYRTTFMALLKDDKLHRAMLQRVEL